MVRKVVAVVRAAAVRCVNGGKSFRRVPKVLLWCITVLLRHISTLAASFSTRTTTIGDMGLNIL